MRSPDQPKRVFTFVASLTGVLAATCALSSGARAHDLTQLWSTLNDSVRTFETRHRAFLEVTRGVDALTRAQGSQSKKRAISQCAGFALLMEANFQMNNSEPGAALAEAGILLTQSETLYSELFKGMRRGIPGYAKPLGDPIRRVRERVEGVMETGIEHAIRIGDTISPERLASSISRNEIPRIRREGIRRMAGLPKVAAFTMPDWLSFHSGSSKAVAKGDITQGTQGPANGYVQVEGDLDATGRHEHLISMAIMGFATETLSQEQQDQHSGLNAAIYTKMGDMAPSQAENGAHQNHSPSDLLVNHEGIQMGRALAYNKIRNKPWPAGEMNRRTYLAVCDESKVDVAIKGPLSVEQLSKAFASATKSLLPLK